MIRIGQAAVLLAEDGLRKSDIRRLADGGIIPCQRSERGDRFFDVYDVISFKQRLREAEMAGENIARFVVMGRK